MRPTTCTQRRGTECASSPAAERSSRASAPSSTFDGTGTDGAALLSALPAAQRLLGRPGEIKHVLISNRGGAARRASATPTRSRRCSSRPSSGSASRSTRSSATRSKRPTQKGNAFMSLFTTFGSFSIFAGFLLIFLIFVMLAAERRGELGIARAVGTRRGHLVQMFLFEGAAYDLLAAAVGAALGVAVAFGMVLHPGERASAAKGVDDRATTSAAQPRRRVRARRAADVRRRRVLRLAGQPAEHRQPRSGTCPNRRAQKRRKRRWMLAVSRGRARRAADRCSAVARRRRCRSSLGVALLTSALVPIAPGARRAASASRTRSQASCSSSCACCRSIASTRWCGRAADELLDLDRLRA